jgi:hypothetical protein
MMATRIIHGWPVSSECAMVEVTTSREGCEFEDLDYAEKEEGIENLKDDKGNFILLPRKDIILKTHSSPIVSPQSRADEGTPTSQNTTRNTTGFTPPTQNPPQTTPPPKNPPSTQPLEHHSPQYRSPPHGHSPKSPPHTTPPQNPPIEQAPQHHSPLHGHSPKSPLHTTSPQNPPTDKLLSIILLHMVILQSLLFTLLLLKIHQLNKLLNIVLLHMFIC